MQQTPTQEQIEYASLGWRFAAVLVDTLVLLGLLIIAFMVYIFVLAAQGKVDLNDPVSVQALGSDFQSSDLSVNLIVFGALFVYYVVLEAVFGASVGKLVFRMRVTMRDGSRPRGAAVLVRNLIRIPEAWLLYIPAGISCLVSGKRQRLGDHAARTVVVRRRPAPATVPAAAADGAAPWPAPAGPPPPEPPAAPAPSAAPPAAPPAAWPATSPAQPGLGDALAGLKTAALAARGAHLNYLRFSEVELAATRDPETSGGYSQAYVSAWLTLADTVATLRGAQAAAGLSAAAAGTTLEQACADQPDLLHLLRELEPYASAGSDEAVHEAFLRVARGGPPTP